MSHGLSDFAFLLALILVPVIRVDTRWRHPWTTMAHRSVQESILLRIIIIASIIIIIGIGHHSVGREAG